MALHEIIDLLNEENDISKQALIIRKYGIECFVDNPNKIIPYLDALRIYANELNSAYLKFIFSNIELTDYKLMNKAFEICLSVFHDYKYLEEIIDNFSKNTGIFVFDTDDTFFKIACRMVEQSKKYNVQTIKTKEAYTIILRKK